MSLFRRAVNRGKAKSQQKNTCVTNALLLDFGFEQEDLHFKMADLTIFLIEGYHYYLNANYKLVRINNCWTVAQLVYGNIKYFPNDVKITLATPTALGALTSNE